VQALPSANPDAKIVMAAKAGIGVEAFARRVAFAAVRIAIDVGMRACQLSRRQKLRPGPPRHQRSANRCADGNQ
jgi:hypothetical protein